MTNQPEYPFKYIGVLNERHRKQAVKDAEWCREQVFFVITQLLPRVGKSEFVEWVEAIWEEADESYQDHLSMPDV